MSMESKARFVLDEDKCIGCGKCVATTYFELLCNAHGLGTAIMSYPAEVLNELAPAARDMLGIPPRPLYSPDGRLRLS